MADGVLWFLLLVVVLQLCVGPLYMLWRCVRVTTCGCWRRCMMCTDLLLGFASTASTACSCCCHATLWPSRHACMHVHMLCLGTATLAAMSLSMFEKLAACTHSHACTAGLRSRPHA